MSAEKIAEVSLKPRDPYCLEEVKNPSLRGFLFINWSVYLSPLSKEQIPSSQVQELTRRAFAEISDGSNHWGTIANMIYREGVIQQNPDRKESRRNATLSVGQILASWTILYIKYHWGDWEKHSRFSFERAVDIAEGGLGEDHPLLELFSNDNEQGTSSNEFTNDTILQDQEVLKKEKLTVANLMQYLKPANILALHCSFDAINLAKLEEEGISQEITRLVIYAVTSVLRYGDKEKNAQNFDFDNITYGGFAKALDWLYKQFSTRPDFPLHLVYDTINNKLRNQASH